MEPPPPPIITSLTMFLLYAPPSRFFSRAFVLGYHTRNTQKRQLLLLVLTKLVALALSDSSSSRVCVNPLTMQYRL